MNSTNEQMQYEIQYPSEYTEPLVTELGNLMGIDIDIEKLKKAMSNDGTEPSEDTYCLFVQSQSGDFILLDCLNIDVLYAIVVRCKDKIHEDVKTTLLKWDNLARTEYRQELREDLDNTMSDEESDFRQIVELYDLKIK